MPKAGRALFSLYFFFFFWEGGGGLRLRALGGFGTISSCVGVGVGLRDGSVRVGGFLQGLRAKCWLAASCGPLKPVIQHPCRSFTDPKV